VSFFFDKAEKNALIPETTAFTIPVALAGKKAATSETTRATTGQFSTNQLGSAARGSEPVRPWEKAIATHDNISSEISSKSFEILIRKIIAQNFSSEQI
jgi:hypothetical protein